MPEVKEHPIIMSTPMVKATRDGLKTQTRRVIKPTRETEWLLCDDWTDDYIKDPGNYLVSACPYGQVRDWLWCKETYQLHTYAGVGDKEAVLLNYRAGGMSDWYLLKDINPKPPFKFERWQPSIFMPRWASRITLEITEIRVERVQEISLEDIWDEGIRTEGHLRTGNFKKLWNSINAKRKPTKYDREHGITELITPSYAWESNPWVWCISFKVVGNQADKPIPPNPIGAAGDS